MGIFNAKNVMSANSMTLLNSTLPGCTYDKQQGVFCQGFFWGEVLGVESGGGCVWEGGFRCRVFCWFWAEDGESLSSLFSFLFSVL